MNIRLKIILPILFFTILIPSYGQDLDSIWGIWKDETRNDTVRLDALGMMAGKLLFTDVDSSVVLSDLQVEYSKKWGIKRTEAFGYRTLGNAMYFKGNYPKSLANYQNALRAFKKIDHISGTASSYNSIGMIYHLLGNTEDGIKSTLKALEIGKEYNDTNLLGSTYNSLGAYYESTNPDTSLYYYRLSIEMKEAYGDLNGLGNTYANMGIVSNAALDYAAAIKYQSKALEIFESIGSLNRVAGIKGHLGGTYAENGDFEKAIEICLEGLEESKQMKSLAYQAKNCDCIYLGYKGLGNYKESLVYLEMAMRFNDTLKSQKNKEDALHQKYKFKYEEKAAIDSVKAKDAVAQHELEIQTEKAKTEKLRWQSVALVVGIGCVVLVLLFIVQRLRVTRRQKAIIEQQKTEVENQKELIEAKSVEITASIQYAQRIQEAILPSENLIDEHLKDNFVLYLPKDIVAGDFYWMDTVGDIVLFAAADCTGHGVPGAMVSVVCHNALNRCTREFGLSKPSDILDKCRELVIASFESGIHDVQDGMDISVCALNPTTLELSYAGANNDLYHMSNGEMTIIGSDRQPIGKYIGNKPFKSHDLKLNSGDHIYLFTDGFADQFGGDKGKKFKYKHFKDLLLHTSTMTVSEQKEKIESAFNKWRGELEQVDDVCVIGVRL